MKAGAGRITVAPGDGQALIFWQGRAYRSPSDLAFAPLLGVTKFNGWEYWRADLPEGRRTLAAVRASFLGNRDDREEAEEASASS